MYQGLGSYAYNLENILMMANVMTEAQLKEIKEMQYFSGKRIEQLVVEKGYVDEDRLAELISDYLGYPLIQLKNISIDEHLAKIIPKEVADKYCAVPFKVEDDIISIALTNPTDILAIDDIRLVTGKVLKLYIASEKSIRETIEKTYSSMTSSRAVEELKNEFGFQIEASVAENNKREEDLENAPTVRLVNSILTTAIEMKASDIHIEPFEHYVLVRYRLDGSLVEKMNFPQKIYDSVSTRFKIMGEMNIAEKRIPQDGRIEMLLNGANYDFRVSSLPTVFGEKIVIRILDRTASIIDRKDMGFSAKDNSKLDDILKMPNGILLVTGPTGSGKTTTLYGFLNEMNTPDKNIITIEDPVEYMLERINQVQVNVKAGLTFASGLRSMLRQDPDVIMLGEIRDEETVQIAVRASITGHFVLSTLHTNDAPSTITRLLDMGIQPYLAADAIVGIIAQRLVRRLCPHCKAEKQTSDYDMKVLGLDQPITIWEPVGCERCNGLGYKGRRAVHEVMKVGEKLKVAIENQETNEVIRKVAIEEGMDSLYVNCKHLVLKGETSIDELVRTVHARS